MTVLKIISAFYSYLFFHLFGVFCSPNDCCWLRAYTNAVNHLCALSVLSQVRRQRGDTYSQIYISIYNIELGEPNINIIYTFNSDISWHNQHKFNSLGAYIHSTSSSKQPNMKIYDMFARIMSNFCLLIKRIFIDVHI